MTRHSRHAVWFLMALLVVPTLASGCTRSAAQLAGAATPAPSYGPDVVSMDGLRDVQFGEAAADMITRGVLNPTKSGCGPRLVDITQASPVFAEDRLVLLWFNPPLATPEGVMVGTPVAEVRQHYPDARELTPPANSYTFPGLLVVRGERAFLFLHDGGTVQKAIAGYETYARKLFDTGFGSC